MMNRKSVAVFACCILLLALIATGDDQNQNECTYTIKIITACEEPGMTNPATTTVDVKFGDGRNGPGISIQNISSKLEDVHSKPFNACATDSFKYTDKCLESKICSFYVRLNGEGDWKVESAKVEVAKEEDREEDLSSDVLKYPGGNVSNNKWEGVETCSISLSGVDLDPPVDSAFERTLGRGRWP